MRALAGDDRGAVVSPWAFAPAIAAMICLPVFVIAVGVIGEHPEEWRRWTATSVLAVVAWGSVGVALLTAGTAQLAVGAVVASGIAAWDVGRRNSGRRGSALAFYAAPPAFAAMLWGLIIGF